MASVAPVEVLTPERPVLVNTVCPALPDCGPDLDRVLRCIETGQGLPRPGVENILRVAFWNAERGYTPEYAADLLARTCADVALLCELDNGVARTGQRHVTRDIARQLRAGYLYAVEFVEMESREAGELGLHGNAIISQLETSTPFLVRMADDKLWQSGQRRARRTGSRIALAARVKLDGTPVVVVTTHLESHTTPDTRAAQMQGLIDAVDDYARGDPILIGGDFNTRTAAKDDLRTRDARLRLRRDTPTAFTRPAPHEPLFAVAAAAGYDWVACNTDAPTERAPHPGDDTPRFRLDWFFAKGLVCENPGVVIAESETGAALSDHDAITVDIRLP
jgi:endonuclease/exonuclease/phosphatase family metal-dependent hydrolase